VKSIVKKKGEWRLDELQKWMHASSASSPPPSQELQPWCEVLTMSEQGLCSAVKLPPPPLSLSYHHQQCCVVLASFLWYQAVLLLFSIRRAYYSVIFLEMNVSFVFCIGV
jgi:hypothetical protein